MRGISSRNIAGHQEIFGAIPYIVGLKTSTTASTYQLFPNGAPFTVIVTGMYGILHTQAGGGGDTIQLQDGSSNAITEAVDISALLDKDKWDASVVDDAYFLILKGDKLKVVTASAALSYVAVEMIRADENLS